MSISSGRATRPRKRCAASRIATTPTSPINVSGPEILVVRDLASEFGKLFGKEPVFVGKEDPTAWLTDTSQAVKLFGLPVVDTAANDQMDRRLGGAVDAEPRQADQIRGARWKILSTSRSASSAPGDAAGGLLLSTEAHWNQNEADWRFFLSKGIVFGVRDRKGDLVATAALLPYTESDAWISMVLVTESWRRRGLATRLVDTCLTTATKLGLTTWLDATPAGATVYGPLGFTPTHPVAAAAACEYSRLGRCAASGRHAQRIHDLRHQRHGL